MTASSALKTEDPPEPPDPFEVVEEHRELFERVAAADLPISERVRRVLDLADGERGDRDVE